MKWNLKVSDLLPGVILVPTCVYIHIYIYIYTRYFLSRPRNAPRGERGGGVGHVGLGVWHFGGEVLEEYRVYMTCRFFGPAVILTQAKGKQKTDDAIIITIIHIPRS